jgi:Zinc finger, C3HC4 type (RING finger)
MSVLTYKQVKHIFGTDGPMIMDMYGFERTYTPIHVCGSRTQPTVHTQPTVATQYPRDSDSTVEIYKSFNSIYSPKLPDCANAGCCDDVCNGNCAVTVSPVAVSPVTVSPVAVSPVAVSLVAASPVAVSPVAASPVAVSPIVVPQIAPIDIPTDVLEASQQSAIAEEKERMRRELEAQQQYISDLEKALNESQQYAIGWNNEQVQAMSQIQLRHVQSVQLQQIAQSQQLSQPSQNPECMICLNDAPNAVNTVFIPCGHTCCAGCSASVDTCPKCRAAISSRYQFYI